MLAAYKRMTELEISPSAAADNGRQGERVFARRRCAADDNKFRFHTAYATDLGSFPQRARLVETPLIVATTDYTWTKSESQRSVEREVFRAEEVGIGSGFRPQGGRSVGNALRLRQVALPASAVRL